MESAVRETLARVEEAARQAEAAMGEAAVALVRDRMLTGYARPVRRSGRLMEDVRWARDSGGVVVGNTLPYAPPVHDGTAALAARPYLAEGIAGSAEELVRLAEKAMREGMG